MYTDAARQQAEIELLKVRLENAEDDAARLRAALSPLLDRYIGLVESGDCGSWNPYEETEVIAAQEALGELPLKAAAYEQSQNSVAEPAHHGERSPLGPASETVGPDRGSKGHGR